MSPSPINNSLNTTNKPHIILNNNDDSPHYYLPSQSNIYTNIFLYIIPPDHNITTFYCYPTRNKINNIYLINHITNYDNQFDLLKNYFINLVINYFTRKEESYNDLMKGNCKNK